MDLADQSSSNQFWHKPEKPNGIGLVLTHGAGGDCRAPLLLTVAEACCAAGVTVMRFNLPFRVNKRPPNPATAVADRAGLKAMTELMRQNVAGQIVMGGHSYGGRQASILASEEPGAADRLLLLSYPLHPPAKPEQLRTAHFPEIRVPVLFVSGTKDEFGSPDEFKKQNEAIPGPVNTYWIEGARHDLKRGKFDLSPLVQFVSGKF